MRQLFKLALASLLVTVLTASISVSPVAAFNVFNPPDSNGNPTGVDCSKGSNSQSAVCSDNTTNNPIAGPGGWLARITTIVAIVAGIAAVIIIVVGGIRYITSGGDPEKVSSAKRTVTYALVGLVVIVLAQTLITYVVDRL